MIRATPNCVKWEQVNRVNYRFQALNFQSDILEALVLNSPPLLRKDRAISDASTPPDVLLSSPATRKRMGLCRSLSLDEAKRTSRKIKEISLLNHTISKKIIPMRKVGIAHQIVLPADLIKDNSENSKSENSKVPQETVGLQKKIDYHCDVSEMATKDTSRSDKNAGVAMSSCTLVTDCTACEKPPTDLGSKTKEELMELVYSLNKELKEAKRPSTEIHHKTDSATTVEHTGFNTNSSLSPSRPEVRITSHFSEQDQQKNDHSDSSLIKQIHLLEMEIQRAQNITTKFEKELHSLKSRLSKILSKSQSVHDDYNVLAEDMVINGVRLDINSTDRPISTYTIRSNSS